MGIVQKKSVRRYKRKLSAEEKLDKPGGKYGKA
jgi:hypothetical protein